MIETLIHSSQYNNTYIYDDQLRLSMLIHPELKKAYEKKTEAASYYTKKYIYLTCHGFFSKPIPRDFLLLDESLVRDNIVNTEQIVFEVTSSCNLNCSYCALGEIYQIHDDTNKNMNINTALNLLRYILNLKPENSMLIISFYGGEALLNMNFIRNIVSVSNKLGNEKKIKIEFSITTNGTLLDKYIDFLVMNNFKLLISLDGNEKNHSYRKYKNKKESFYKIIKNIDIIHHNYPEYFYSYVQFNSVLHNRNSVNEIYEFIYLRYGIIPRISELNMRYVKPDKKNILDEMYHSKRESEANFKKINSDLSSTTHAESSSYSVLMNFLKYCSINYYISNIKALLNNKEKYLPTNTCSPFAKKIFMTNQNKLLPCEKINYKYFFGEVNENVEFDISNITRKYNFYFEHLKKYCQICYASRFCGTCLFQLQDIDSIGSKEFVCENFKNKDSFEHNLHRIFSFLEENPNDFSEILENTVVV